MTNRQRLLELVKLILQQRGVDDDTKLTCLDCFLTIPKAFIPARRSLRYFVHDTIDCFLGESNHCELHYPDAATYIQKWRKVWVIKEFPSSHIPKDHPTIVWTTNTKLVVETVAGSSALASAGIAAEELIGKSLFDFWGTLDPAHPVIAGHFAALRGEFAVNHITIKVQRWRVLTRPKFSDGKVNGVYGVGVILHEPEYTPQKFVKQLPSLAFPVAMWRCDNKLVVTHAAGGGFDLVGIAAKSFVGTNLRAFYGQDEWWAVETMERALAGEVVMTDHAFRGHSWHYVFAPIIVSKEVTGIYCVATLVPGIAPRPVSDDDFLNRNTLPPGKHEHN